MFGFQTRHNLRKNKEKKMPPKKVKQIEQDKSPATQNGGVPTEAFEYFDEQDAQAEIARYNGAEFGFMVYKFPVAGTEVCGVGINGILELRQHWGGIDVRVIGVHADRHNGMDGYRADVEAADLFTGNRTQQSYFEAGKKKKKDGSYYENPYAYLTAQAKAKRNAIRDLLPQAPLKKIAELAKKGKTTFDEADVEEIFGRQFFQRKALVERFFQAKIALAAGTIAGALPAPLVRQVLGTGHGEPLKAATDPLAGRTPSPTIDAQVEEEDVPKGVANEPPSQDQIKALYKILPKYFELPDIARYIAEKVTTWAVAAELIPEFSEGNVSDFQEWLDKRNAPQGDTLFGGQHEKA
jgi:hypothetical protein